MNLNSPQGKPYFILTGSEVEGWRLNVMMWTEDRFYRGNFGVTTLWNMPKTYETLDAALAELKSCL